MTVTRRCGVLERDLVLHAISRQSLVAVAAVVEAGEIQVLERTFPLRMLEQRQVNEDILVRHLDAEGALRADSLHGSLHVNRADVSQASRQDVHAYKSTCGKNRKHQLTDTDSFLLLSKVGSETAELHSSAITPVLWSRAISLWPVSPGRIVSGEPHLFCRFRHCSE